MEIDLKFLKGEATERWFRYAKDDAFEVLIRFAKPTEWDALHAGRKFSDIPDAELAEFVVAHVLDWRGLVSDGKPVPYTPADARSLMEQVRAFGLWLFLKLRDTASFLGPAGDSASSQAGVSDGAAALGAEVVA
jgi:hypothetical protein